jgi:hypothetical protein
MHTQCTRAHTQCTHTVHTHSRTPTARAHTPPRTHSHAHTHKHNAHSARTHTHTMHTHSRTRTHTSQFYFTPRSLQSLIALNPLYMNRRHVFISKRTRLSGCAACTGVKKITIIIFNWETWTQHDGIILKLTLMYCELEQELSDPGQRSLTGFWGKGTEPSRA